MSYTRKDVKSAVGDVKHELATIEDLSEVHAERALEVLSHVESILEDFLSEVDK